MKINAELLRANQVNLNGRVYTTECVERMIDQFNARKAETGCFFGQVGFPDNLEVSLSKVSHSVESLTLINDVLVGEIRILDTPEGKILKSLVEANMKDYNGILVEMVDPNNKAFVFRPRMFGSVNENDEVEMERIISFDAVPADEDSFKGLLDGETRYTRIWQ